MTSKNERIHQLSKELIPEPFNEEDAQTALRRAIFRIAELEENVKELAVNEAKLEARIDQLTRSKDPSILTLEDLLELPMGSLIQSDGKVDIAYSIYGWVPMTAEGKWLSGPKTAQEIYFNYPRLRKYLQKS